MFNPTLVGLADDLGAFNQEKPLAFSVVVKIRQRFADSIIYKVLVQVSTVCSLTLLHLLPLACLAYLNCAIYTIIRFIFHIVDIKSLFVTI